MQSKRKSWKLWLGAAAAAAALAMPVSVTTAHAAEGVELITSEAPTAQAPVLITGSVEKYYTDQSGLVTALDLNATAMGTRRVRFAPSWAQRLLRDYPVGTSLSGWVIEHNDYAHPVSDLVSIGAERPNRFLTDNFHTGAQRLSSRAWIWNDAASERVTGTLDRIIVNSKGEVLALALKDGTLVRVPRSVKHMDRGAKGSKHIAQLFPGAQVTAWGPQVWNSSGEVSIYGQRIASEGLSINGKTVSAIGIQKFDAGEPLLGSMFNTEIDTEYGYSPYDASMQKTSPPPTLMSMNSNCNCAS